MHTTSFNRVIEKLQLSGREYLDGFSSTDFIGLSFTEKDEIKSILIDRASRGDAVALGGVEKLLPTEEYLCFLEELIVTQCGNKLFYTQLATTICKIRGGDEAWDRVIDCLANSDIPGKRWTLLRLSDLPIPVSMHHRLIAALQAIIRDERDKVVLLMSSGILLKLSGIQPKTDTYMDLAKRLQSSNQNDRNHALMYLENT